MMQNDQTRGPELKPVASLVADSDSHTFDPPQHLTASAGPQIAQA
jgi:hypothetical protein